MEEADPRVRRYHLPVRIVWQTVPNAPENPENLLTLHTDQTSARETPSCILRNGAGLLLDFGRALHGGVQVMLGRTRDKQPVALRIRFGESATEAMSAPNNDHSIHDEVCLVPWLGTRDVGSTVFRFVRLDLAQADAWAAVKQVRAVSLMRPDPYLGSFECSDDRLNRIWQTGAHTVHLCMQDYLWDAAKRDRLVWIGDMHPEAMVVATVFGNHSIVPRSLDFVRDETPLPGWMNGICSYSIWWVLIQHSWYLYQGDRAYLSRQRDYLLGLMDQLLTYIGPDDTEALADGRRFLDWPSEGDAAAVRAGLHGLLMLGMRAGEELCTVLGEKQMQERCGQALDRLRRDPPDTGTSKQATALQVLAGAMDPGPANERVLAPTQVGRLSTYYGYYVLQARAMAGDYPGCLRTIREYWGAMLDRGATSCWEDFDLAWLEGSGRIDELTPTGKKDLHADYGAHCYKGLRHSLSHGWAGGPTAWLSEHVLGIRPAEAGFSAVRIEPHLGDLEFAQGTFPTPHGLIRVRHEAGAGHVNSEVTLPEGVRRA